MCSKLVGVLLAVATQLAVAQDFMFGGPPMGAANMELKSLADSKAYEVGKPFLVAMQGTIPSPWHAYYYKNPGTVGEKMQASLQAPNGFSVEGPFWQIPTLHKSSIGAAYVYENPVVVWRITPQTDAPESAHFVMRAEAQLCSDSGCMPTQRVETELDMQRGEAAANPAWQGLERQVETLGDAPLQKLSARRTPNGVTLTFVPTLPEGETLKSAYFFSDDNSVAPAADQVLTKSADVPGAYELALTINDGKNFMYPAPANQNISRLEGMLVLADGTHGRVDVSMDAPAAGVPDGLWDAVLGLFIGGLLLNLMPCVFPVLGLKIMSFVSLGGGSRARVVVHSVIFSLGILVSFWLLGLVLVGVSNADALAQAPLHDWFSILWGDVGSSDRTWATWMQNEWVVYGITLLLLALGLGMFGVYEIGAGATGIGSELQQKGGYVGSFFQGCLITLVATPCSAPYLGPAIAVVMAFPAVWMLVALTGMALGLALPYLLLSVFPALVRLLPRPGAWMESLKQGLSFLLFAAAAWQLAVYLSFVEAAGRGGDLLWILMSLVVFCMAFWVFGRWCPLYRSKLSRILGLLVALGLLAVGVLGSMPREKEELWQPWSPEAMKQALEEGSPVYVDFTAKWCATCQSNKMFAYTDEVYNILNEHDVVLMRADKTQPNPAIDAELRRLNRSAVPTNALYLPKQEPVVTSELLTPAYLLYFFRKHLKE